MEVQELFQQFRKAVPQIEFEHVDVVFPVANQDLVIPTILRPASPEEIFYRVVDIRCFSAPAVSPCIYRDVSLSRREWTKGIVILRCNVANTVATLELFVESR